MIDVCCAIIVNDEQQVLVAQRSAVMRLPLKMEFPGGKLEPGESPEAALIREIQEELNLHILPVKALPVHEHQYPDFAIRLIPFICKLQSGAIELREHAAVHWLEAPELIACDWAEADIPVMHDYLFTLTN